MKLLLPVLLVVVISLKVSADPRNLRNFRSFRRQEPRAEPEPEPSSRRNWVPRPKGVRAKWLPSTEPGEPREPREPSVGDVVTLRRSGVEKLREQKLRDEKLREQKLREQKLREQKLREQKQREQKLREQKLREQKLREDMIQEDRMRSLRLQAKELKETHGLSVWD